MIPIPRTAGVGELRCEWNVDPIGIDAAHPRLSWQLLEERHGARQQAYEVIVRSADREVWRSGRVESVRSVSVPYAGEPLSSRQRCEWQVRVWDEQGEASAWSEPARWEMGLLDRADWVARWIGPHDDARAKERPCPLLRYELVADGQPQRARLYATAHGVYEIELNGRRVGEELLRPGWTAYRHRLQYQTYDVIEHIESGANAIGVTLADGWWRGETTGGRRRNWYGDQLAVLLQLEIELEDSGRVVASSGPGWRWSTGPFRAADPFRGETYDARRRVTGWAGPGFDDSAWSPVPVLEQDVGGLVAQHGPGVRRTGEIVASRVIRTPNGQTVVDLGQNMVGWVRLRAAGAPGSTITLRHGETLDRRGNLATRNGVMPFDPPTQEMRYTPPGEGEETYAPHFSTAGFRYAAVEGVTGGLRPEQAVGVVVGSDLTTIGTFSCSDERVNRLHENIVWSQRGNFVEVPTDCPTRERSGWTGDLQCFASTAVFTMDSIAFLERWLADLAADQSDDGKVPDVIPWVQSTRALGSGTGSTGWGDASTIVPWLLYSITGDPSILERQFDSMTGWVQYLARRARRRPRPWRLLAGGRAVGHRRYIVDSGFHWGDHYPTTRDSVIGIGRRLFVPPALVATSFFAHSAALTGRAARVLGREAQAELFEDLHAQTKRAFQAEFLDADGSLTPHEQTSYVMALAFDLLPEELRPQAAEHLVRLIREAGDHATTGFMATPYLLPVLADTGHADVAYDVLLQEEPPSWLATVAQGATTMWESLRAVTPSGRIRFRSLNHYALGAVGDFLHRYTAGLDIARIGLGSLDIHPVPGGGLTSAAATYHSVHGRCRVAWSTEKDRTTIATVIPPNVSARVTLPGARVDEITEAGRRLEGHPGITAAHQDEHQAVLTVEPGSYQFGWTTL